MKRPYRHGPAQRRRLSAQHVIDRAKERYGMDVNFDDVAKLNAAVDAGALPWAHHGHIIVYDLKLRDRTIYAVWHRARHCLVTVITEEMAFKHRAGT